MGLLSIGKPPHTIWVWCPFSTPWPPPNKKTTTKHIYIYIYIYIYISRTTMDQNPITKNLSVTFSPATTPRFRAKLQPKYPWNLTESWFGAFSWLKPWAISRPRLPSEPCARPWSFWLPCGATKYSPTSSPSLRPSAPRRASKLRAAWRACLGGCPPLKAMDTWSQIYVFLGGLLWIIYYVFFGGQPWIWICCFRESYGHVALNRLWAGADAQICGSLQGGFKGRVLLGISPILFEGGGGKQ